MKRALERHPKIRLIHVLDDRFTGYTAGGAWQDAVLGLAHAHSFDRIAVVTDSESIRRLVKRAGWSIPGELKLFPNREREQAEAWASEGLDARTLSSRSFPRSPPREAGRRPGDVVTVWHARSTS